MTEYSEEIRRFRSLLIVTSLQKRRDLHALHFIQNYLEDLDWNLLDHFLIDQEVWVYVVDTQKYDPKLVFCHPDILLANPSTCLYYRGLCGLSLKAAKEYMGSVDMFEMGKSKTALGEEKALKIARTLNTFICSVIKNSTDWTLENGKRTIIATLGITLDGVMRNKIGHVAEERIRTLILEWLLENELIISPKITRDQIYSEISPVYTLPQNTIMRFGSEPDISFIRDDALKLVIEIKGGIDPAGALERYGAATKSFQHSISISPRCKNFYLSASFTQELNKRINEDRLVERAFDIIELLDNPKMRERFFEEIFHHTLRLI
ncbi:MAG: XcyI family restriction endonuclease [Candidatus Omnitrophota bacterium]|jgi:hypothetical protein|nr:MAG: XcyI family restriction endonuclease [Candidatus Omnitrophota bacterium]